ncbi:unnamed protein product [Orchesella dallaii]|uniref:Odorant receptor n=1 Tax=Orchesella dallaii TaxID=48710 RepID=A0ABP1PT67_9HEXA
MIVTNFMLSLITWRLKVAKCFCFCTPIDTTSNNSQYIRAPSYFFWNMLLFNKIGTLFPIILGIYSYTKIYDEGEFNGTKWIDSPKNFATTMIGLVFMCGVIFILILGHRITNYVTEILYLQNQLVKYIKQIERLMTSSRLKLDKNQRRTVKQAENMCFLLLVFTTIFPPLYGAILVIDYEPTHNVFKDWLEIELEFKLKHFPILLVFGYAALNAGTIIFIVIVLALLYLWPSLVCLSSLIPQHVYPLPKYRQRRNKFTLRVEIHYIILTNSFGMLWDEDVIKMYRVQQIFNIFVNEIFASPFISMHQVGVMIVLVGASFVIVTIPRIILEAGIVASGFTLGGFLAVVLLLYLECSKLGEILEVTEHFVKRSKVLTSRRSMFRKFVASCPPMTMKMAHPFYKLRKTTFLEFFSQYSNFLTTLLVLSK